MGFNFPDAPTPGQVYGSYTWDAATGAWKLTGGGGSGGGGSITISDTPPASPVAGALWWESDTGNLYIFYVDPGGPPGQWVLAVPAMSASSIGAVAYTPQTLTVPQQTIARQNIYAAPFDAMAYSGMQINGSMEVSQELGGTAIGTNGKYICDGFSLSHSTGATVSAVASVGGSFPGFKSRLSINVSVGATPTGTLNTGADIRIEGYRMSRLAWGSPDAQPMTIGFWTAHNRTGVYSVTIRNSAVDTCYVATYTQIVSDAPEYKTITVPPPPVGTAWLADSGIGMFMYFAMAVGPTRTAPSSSGWFAGSNYTAALGQVNAVAATTDVFRITGVVVLPGIEAPSAARSPLIMRPYDQELVTCKRYFIQFGGLAFEKVSPATGITATAGMAVIPLAVPLRSSPTLTLSAASDFQIYNGSVVTLSGMTLDVVSPNSVPINLAAASGIVAGASYTLQTISSVSPRLKLDARL